MAPSVNLSRYVNLYDLSFVTRNIKKKHFEKRICNIVLYVYRADIDALTFQLSLEFLETIDLFCSSLCNLHMARWDDCPRGGMECKLSV